MCMKSLEERKQEFIKKAKDKFGDKFDYSKVEYINSRTKVCIICPEHGEFWQTPSVHLSGSSCQRCGIERTLKSTRYDTGELEKLFHEIHKNKYKYNFDTFKNVNSKIEIVCPYHGSFYQRVEKHLRECGCPKCNGGIKYSLNEFIEKANKIHNYFYSYSKVEYINSDTEIIITCPVHGDFYQKPSTHLKGSGCQKCAIEKSKLKNSLNNHEFIEKSKSVHGDKYDYSKVVYINTDTIVDIICPDHGVFSQKPRVHIAGFGCPKCLLKSQTRVFNIFVNEFKDLVFEYSTEWIKPQRFDMYLKEYNIAIEYNGKQHYHPVDIFGGEEGFKICQERDKRKMEKCLQNNCKLFIVRYDHEEEDIKYIINEINKIIKNYENCK